MRRALLCVAIVAVQLAAGQGAWCRAPDEVAFSPVPPLEQTLQQRATRAAAGNLLPTGVGPAHERVLLPPPAASAKSVDFNSRPQMPCPQQGDTEGAHVEGYSLRSSNSQQLEIWNSPDMLEARNAVMEFCRRSARTSPAEGQQFLARLSRLSPDKMRLWLERFQARRTNASRGQELARKARQLAVEGAIRRQEAIRQTAQNIAEMRRQAAEPTEEQLSSKPRLEAANYHYVPHGGPGSMGATLSYDPFSPEFDPSSPRGYARRVAAAMSLPGDLPASDPRNFIRDLEAVDLGESAATHAAEPATAIVAPGNNSPIGQ